MVHSVTLKREFLVFDSSNICYNGIKGERLPFVVTFQLPFIHFVCRFIKDNTAIEGEFVGLAAKEAITIVQYRHLIRINISA